MADMTWSPVHVDRTYSKMRRRAQRECKGFGPLRNAVFAEGSMSHHPTEVAFASRLEATYVCVIKNSIRLEACTNEMTWIYCPRL